MKRLLLALILVFGFVGVSYSADIQKLYLTGSSSSFDVENYDGELDNVNKWGVEGRAKVALVGGFGVDSRLDYRFGDSFDAAVLTTGVFYQPTGWSEVSYSTSFGVDDFGSVGDDSVVKISIGKGF